MLIGCIVSCPKISIGQSDDSTATHNISYWLSGKWMDRLTKHYEHLEDRVIKNAEHSLTKLQKQEKKLQRSLARKDSLQAKKVFQSSQQFYNDMSSRLTGATGKVQKYSNYIPGLDSIQTATKYLQQSSKVFKQLNPDQLKSLGALGSKAQSLQARLSAATDVQQMLKARRAQLKSALEQYGLTKPLKELNKQVYYYQQQLNDYKDMLQDEKKLENKALSLLREQPLFRQFMQKNSLLSQLFPQPENFNTGQALAGLQTRSSVIQQIQSRMGSGGGVGGGNSGAAYVQQQLQQAQGQLSQLKDKLNKLGGGNSDLEMPEGFKPNSQKTKTLLQRLEYGLNMQSQRPNGLLPVTSDIAVTLGYKLNDKSVIGIGASYKLGWGSGINHIQLSNQGVGLRSYVDIKLKGSIWMTGGYEQNYMQGFDKIPLLNDYSKWQSSGLIGLSKKYKVGKKKGNLQLLWDFLSYRQLPRTEPLKFRVGYTF